MRFKSAPRAWSTARLMTRSIKVSSVDLDTKRVTKISNLILQGWRSRRFETVIAFQKRIQDVYRLLAAIRTSGIPATFSWATPTKAEVSKETVRIIAHLNTLISSKVWTIEEARYLIVPSIWAKTMNQRKRVISKESRILGKGQLTPKKAVNAAFLKISGTESTLKRRSRDDSNSSLTQASHASQSSVTEHRRTNRTGILIKTSGNSPNGSIEELSKSRKK